MSVWVWIWDTPLPRPQALTVCSKPSHDGTGWRLELGQLPATGQPAIRLAGMLVGVVEEECTAATSLLDRCFQTEWVPLPPGQWHHVVATYTPHQRRLFLNGLLRAEDVSVLGLITSTSWDMPFLIGREFDESVYSWDGPAPDLDAGRPLAGCHVSHVGLFGVALSQQQIQQHLLCCSDSGATNYDLAPLADREELELVAYLPGVDVMSGTVHSILHAPEQTQTLQKGFCQFQPKPTQFPLFWLRPFWCESDPIALYTTRSALYTTLLSIQRQSDGTATLPVELWLYIFRFLSRHAYCYAMIDPCQHKSTIV